MYAHEMTPDQHRSVQKLVGSPDSYAGATWTHTEPAQPPKPETRVQSAISCHAEANVRLHRIIDDLERRLSSALEPGDCAAAECDAAPMGTALECRLFELRRGNEDAACRLLSILDRLVL